MKNTNPHFAFNRSQRNGVVVLAALILVVFALTLFSPFQSTEKRQLSAQEKQELVRLRQKIDSLKKIKREKSGHKIYPFNPNFITDYKGYILGMSTKEIDRLLAFRAKDQWINSTEDFQKVTKVSDTLLAEISPYFDFPDWVIAQQKEKNSKRQNPKTKRHNTSYKALNNARIKDLIKIKGIGETLATRIVRYRKKINGFVSTIQLKDIYGLSYETTQQLLQVYHVKPKEKIQKISINTASLEELAEIVYFNYELARDIVEYRTLHERINSFEELAKIKDFPAYQIERIKLYLTL